MTPYYINILHLIYCNSSRAVLGAGCFLVPATALFSQVFDLQSFRLYFHGGSLHDGRPWHATRDPVITEVRSRQKPFLKVLGLTYSHVKLKCVLYIIYIYIIYMYINMHS